MSSLPEHIDVVDHELETIAKLDFGKARSPEVPKLTEIPEAIFNLS